MDKTILGLWTRTLAVGLLVTGVVCGQDLQPKVILANLDRPCGVAIHPDSGELYVSEGGAGRIIRVVDNEDESAEQSVVAEGFGQAGVGLAESLTLGPCGLLFLNKSNLLIAANGSDANQRGLLIATLTDQSDQVFNAADLPRLALPQDSTGALYSLASSGPIVFASMVGVQGADQILASAIRDGSNLGQAESFEPLKSVVSVSVPPDRHSPTAITVSPRGELVTAVSEGVESGAQSQLAFFRVSDNTILTRLNVDLTNIVALAYGVPQDRAKVRALYALDYGQRESGQGGLFRLDAVLQGNRLGVKAVRISALERPTAMAVGKRGIIYVTLQGGDGKTGKLVGFADGL